MAGLIRREDIDQVRERAHIDEIVGEHVALRPAGVGSLKGLCPFHDERTPSFHVRPAQGYYHCFGCGEGGDVIKFVETINHLSFSEAVQYLADKTGVTLRLSLIHILPAVAARLKGTGIFCLLSRPVRLLGARSASVLYRSVFFLADRRGAAQNAPLPGRLLVLCRTWFFVGGHSRL